MCSYHNTTDPGPALLRTCPLVQAMHILLCTGEGAAKGQRKLHVTPLAAIPAGSNK